VMKLLAKSPADRFQTASEVAELLQSWHAHLQQPDQNPQPPWHKLSICDPESNASWRSPPRRWLIATAAFAFFAFAATIIVLETAKGTIRIETNSETEIPIIIRQGDRDVEHLTVSREGTTSRLKAGRYIIEIDGDDTRFVITGQEVKLSRGGLWVATVHVSELPETDESKLDDRMDGSREHALSMDSVSKYMDYPKAEGLKIWNNILARCPKEGTAIIQFDNSRFRHAIPNTMQAIAEEFGVPVVRMNLDVVHPIYALVKDRILLESKSGPLTERNQRDFIESAANYLTPRQSDVDPRSVLRFDCYINENDGAIGTMNAPAHPLAGTVLAQHDDRTLILGPSSIAGYLEDGHKCLATFHAEYGDPVSVPVDVVHAGPVRLSIHGELVESGLGVYEAAGVPSIPSVQLASVQSAISAGDPLLCGMAKRPTRRQPGGFQNYYQRVYWTTQSITDVGNSNYGDASGPKLVTVAFSGDNMPTWAAFTASGEFVGLGALIDSENKTASILGPQAVHATLRAALPQLEHEGLKQALADKLAAAKPVFEESRASLADEASRLLSQIASMNQLEDRGANSPRSAKWGTTLKQLTRLGAAAVPQIIEELDRTDDERMIASLAFTLRAIGDKRGAPALIRAIPRTGKFMSDCNWIRDDLVDEQLRAFFRQHKIEGTGDGPGCSNAQWELCSALGSLTGTECPISRTYGIGTPRQMYLQKNLLHKNAEQWKAWWEDNSGSMVDDEVYTKVNLPPMPQSRRQLHSQTRRAILTPRWGHSTLEMYQLPISSSKISGACALMMVTSSWRSNFNGLSDW
jgi:hypothetical protein